MKVQVKEKSGKIRVIIKMPGYFQYLKYLRDYRLRLKAYKKMNMSKENSRKPWQLATINDLDLVKTDRMEFNQPPQPLALSLMSSSSLQDDKPSEQTLIDKPKEIDLNLIFTEIRLKYGEHLIKKEQDT